MQPPFLRPLYSILVASIVAVLYFPGEPGYAEKPCRVEEQAVGLYDSEMIVVAQFKSAQKSKRNPQCWEASYTLIGQLAGPLWPNLEKKLKNSTVEICGDSASALPQKDSKWILFFETYMPNQKSYTTFKGETGKIPLSAASLLEAMNQIRLTNAKYGTDNYLLDKFTSTNEKLAE
jgi:hypothetical protein